MCIAGDSTDAAVRLRNMANVSQIWKACGKYRYDNGAMGNGGEPVRTPEEWGNIGGSERGTDSDGYEKGKARVVWPRQRKRRNRAHQSSYSKWRWRGSALEDDQSWGWRIRSGGTWKRGASGRNGPLTVRNGKFSARPATPHRETAAKGEQERWERCVSQDIAKF